MSKYIKGLGPIVFASALVEGSLPHLEDLEEDHSHRENIRWIAVSAK